MRLCFFLLSGDATIFQPNSSTSSRLLFHMTTWPSGLRRVTRNHFSSGGVGSNPAVVVFYCCYLSIMTCIYLKNGPTQIRTGVLRTRISYAAPTPWDLLCYYYSVFVTFLLLLNQLSRRNTEIIYLLTEDFLQYYPYADWTGRLLLFLFFYSTIKMP